MWGADLILLMTALYFTSSTLVSWKTVKPPLYFYLKTSALTFPLPVLILEQVPTPTKRWIRHSMFSSLMRTHVFSDEDWRMYKWVKSMIQQSNTSKVYRGRLLRGAKNIAQPVKCLPYKHKDLSSNLQLQCKMPGTAAQVYNASVRSRDR